MKRVDIHVSEPLFQLVDASICGVQLLLKFFFPLNESSLPSFYWNFAVLTLKLIVSLILPSFSLHVVPVMISRYASPFPSPIRTFNNWGRQQLASELRCICPLLSLCLTGVYLRTTAALVFYFSNKSLLFHLTILAVIQPSAMKSAFF